MLDLNSLFLLTRYKTSVQFSLMNDCASIANDCVVSSMIVFDIRPTCVSLSHVVHCAWHKRSVLCQGVCSPLTPDNSMVIFHLFPGGFVSPMRAALYARVSTHDQQTP